MAEDKSPDQQRRQSSSMGSLPVGRANDQVRRQPHAEDARSKAASSYALPCPPDSRRRLSRDVLSKSLGAHDYRYVQHASPMVASVAAGRASYAALGHYPQVAREYVAGPQHARGYGLREYQAGGYYVPEHPYVPGAVAYPAMGSYDWKASPGSQRGSELATTQDSKARQPVVTQVGLMHQAGDVAAPAATLTVKQQASPGQNASPGEAAAESDWSPTKELLKEDSRSAVYYAGTASEGSSEHHDKPDYYSSISSISSLATSGSTHSLDESEPPQQQVPSQHTVQIDQAPPPPQVLREMQKHQILKQLRDQVMQQQQFHQPQPARQQDDPQKPALQRAPRIKDLRVDTAGRVASVLPVPPVGPPPGYFARPSREQSSSRTKDTDSRSQFSVASLAAPLLPASAASLANRSAMEQACILVNVVLLSVLTGIVAAFLVRQLT